MTASAAQASRHLRAVSGGRLGERRGGHQRHPDAPRLAVPNAVLGTLIFLGTEAMFFAGLISALFVLRASVPVWPPPDQPRLPVAVSGINGLVLLSSGLAMYRALAAARAGRQRELSRWLSITAILGTIFLLVQGVEWARLLRHGFHAAAGVYGATFYGVIGCHAAHVFGGVAALFFVLRQAAIGRYTARDHAAVDACRLYWFFVVGLWPALYVLVYLG